MLHTVILTAIENGSPVPDCFKDTPVRVPVAYRVVAGVLLLVPCRNVETHLLAVPLALLSLTLS